MGGIRMKNYIRFNNCKNSEITTLSATKKIYKNPNPWIYWIKQSSIISLQIFFDDNYDSKFSSFIYIILSHYDDRYRIFH